MSFFAFLFLGILLENLAVEDNFLFRLFEPDESLPLPPSEVCGVVISASLEGLEVDAGAAGELVASDWVGSLAKVSHLYDKERTFETYMRLGRYVGGRARSD